MEGEQPRGTVPGKSTKTSTAARGKDREPLEESSMDMEVENGGTREPDKEPPQGRSGLAGVVLVEPPQQQLEFPNPSRRDLLFSLLQSNAETPGNLKLLLKWSKELAKS